MKNEIVKIAENTWQIKYYWFGMADVYMYLLEGDERALLIDTGYSNTHAIDYVRQVTDKPVILVNSHGHFDHCGGNGDFEEAYLSEKDWQVYETMRAGTFTRATMDHVVELAGIPSSEELEEAIDGAVTILHAPLKPLPEEGYFELGNRQVWFEEVPGHTLGSIAFADEKTGILFSGDSACYEGVLLAFEHSTSVEVFGRSIETMQNMMVKYHLNTIYPSHHDVDVSDELLKDFRELTTAVVNGEMEGTYADLGTANGLLATLGKATILYKTVK